MEADLPMNTVSLAMKLLRIAVLLFLPCVAVEGFGFEPLYERAPIHYHETEADTKVTRFMAKAAKEGLLSQGNDREILRELLEGLEVPVESQVLVFSKTSAQNSRISPQTPRAIYFSDDCYVGWVQGGEIELASFDKKLGMVFHLLNLTGREKGGVPTLTRDRSCLNCHAGSSNRNFPGLMVRSVFPQDSGQPLFQAGTFHTRHDSPIEERWGGWYVSGAVEELAHMGNATADAALRDTEIELRPFAEAGPGESVLLEPFFNENAYLHGAQSDVVALMMLEHQVGVHNAIVEANLTTRAALHRHREMQKAFGEPLDAPLSETNQRVLQSQAERVLRQLLYVGELPLPGGVEGADSFPEAFSANERKTAGGRSLKDFRLYERLMKYRCSHLIYSEAFEHLPEEIRDLVLENLLGILTSPDEWPDFSRLSDSERGHIHEILAETLPDLPNSW